MNSIHLLLDFCEKKTRRENKRFVKQCWDHRCAYCGSQGLTIDHILPLSRGGTNRLNNLLPACSRCNLDKSNDLVEVWYPSKNFYSFAIMEAIEYWRSLTEDQIINLYSNYN